MSGVRKNLYFPGHVTCALPHASVEARRTITYACRAAVWVYHAASTTLHMASTALHMASTALQNASKGYISRVRRGTSHDHLCTYAARTKYQVEGVWGSVVLAAWYTQTAARHVWGSFSKINNTDPRHATSKPRFVRCIGMVVVFQTVSIEPIERRIN